VIPNQEDQRIGSHYTVVGIGPDTPYRQGMLTIILMNYEAMLAGMQ
jgi:hypothetical protein